MNTLPPLRHAWVAWRTAGREVGSAVRQVQAGEYVVLPFNVACGFCQQSDRSLTNSCLTTQPEPALAGAAYGFAELSLAAET